MTERDEPIGLRHGTLAIAPHDPAWAELYEAEAHRIRSALPGTALEIDRHEVPGKPWRSGRGGTGGSRRA